MKALGLTSCRWVTNASRVHLICSAMLTVASRNSQHIMRVCHESFGMKPVEFVHSTSVQMAKTTPAKGIDISRLELYLF
jgi:hypothetical protein